MRGASEKTPEIETAPASGSRATKRGRGTGRGPSTREASVISELMRAAERVRALRFERDVPVLIEDRERITAYVENQIEDDELERARIVYTALGLLPPGLDIKELLLRVMGEQIVGYYDAEEKRLVVRDDVMRAFTRAAACLITPSAWTVSSGICSRGPNGKFSIERSVCAPQ